MTAMMDFYDNFERGDTTELGSGWVQGADVQPASWDRLGIHEGGVVTAEMSRGDLNDYEPDVPSIEDMEHPPADGKFYYGIGAAWRECPDDWLPDVEITWAGNSRVLGRPHVEATPLLYVDVNSPLGGFGVWPSYYTPEAAAAWIGYIGSPPELFATTTSPLLSVVGFQPRRGMKLRLRATQHGVVQVLIDGNSVGTYNVDESLLGSNRHGFALDSHHVKPRVEIPTTHGPLDIRYRNMVPVPKSINTYKHQALELANAQ